MTKRANDSSPQLEESWISLRDELGYAGYLGWFRHSREENGFFIDVYRFWLEPFNRHISLTPENLHYGIFHHCLDKDSLESANGKIDITKLKTISLYAEHAPGFNIQGRVDDIAYRESERQRIQTEILDLPDYLFLLDEVIQGNVEPENAETISQGVLSATIL